MCRAKCGLSKCITRYFVAMAAADLMVVVFAVILEKINYIYLFANFLLVPPVCSVTLVLGMVAMDCSVWYTVAFTFDRFIAICCQNLRNRYCTERTSCVVIGTVGLVSCAQSFPFYFAVDPRRCVPKAEYFTSSVWRAYESFDSIMTPLVPIFLILLFNALTVRYIIAANRIRRGLRNSSEIEKDPEVENRRKSMILLFAISANFIVLCMPYVVHSLNWQVENYTYADKYFSTPIYILQQFGSIFLLLSSCSNTCIYVLTLRKFREELKNGVSYLVTLNGLLCKQCKSA